MSKTLSDHAVALEAAEVRRLATAAAEMGPVADRALAAAEVEHAHGHAGARPDERAAAVARLARDLRRTVDTSPEGWALLVAELALRSAERRCSRVLS